MAAEVLLTKRNKKFFQHEGRLYHFHKNSADNMTQFWHCSKKISENCPVRIHTRNGLLVKQLHLHACASSPTAVSVVRIRNEIKTRALSTQEVNY